MSEWKNPDGSTNVGCREDFTLYPLKKEPKEEPVKAEKPKKAKKK